MNFSECQYDELSIKIRESWMFILNKIYSSIDINVKSKLHLSIAANKNEYFYIWQLYGYDIPDSNSAYELSAGCFIPNNLILICPENIQSIDFDKDVKILLAHEIGHFIQYSNIKFPIFDQIQSYIKNNKNEISKIVTEMFKEFDYVFINDNELFALMFEAYIVETPLSIIWGENYKPN